MALTVTISAALTASLTSALDHGTITLPIRLTAGSSLSNGTGANQADVIFSDQRTLAASGTEDLDLAGSLTGMVGGTVTMATLKAVIVKADSGNTNDVVVSNSAANGVPLFGAAGDSIAVRPGGTFMWIAPGTGVTVTAGTGDLITFANSGAGTGVTYDVVLVGTSA